MLTESDEFDLPKESLEKYLPLFAKNRAEDLARIYDCMSTSNYSELSILAHKIKGTSAAFGHARFGDLAAELETQALACSFENCHALVEQLRVYFTLHLAVHLPAS